MVIENSREVIKLMISVIIPIYNAERFLKECIESVINQTYKDLEIILVNDGSTDHSIDICREYERIDRRIKVISKKNGGQMSAWIEGVKIANGEYFAFVDSDDYIECDMYQLMIDVMQFRNVDLVLCGRRIFDRYKSVENSFQYLQDEYREDCIDEIYKYVFPSLNGCFSQSRCDKLFKREIFVFNMERYCKNLVRTMEDRFIVSSYVLSINSLAVIKKPLYNCRLVNNSSSKRARMELYDIAKLLYKTQQQMLVDKNLNGVCNERLCISNIDYIKMIVQRNICRKNNLTFKDKIMLSGKLLNDKEFSVAVLNHKQECVAKFGKFIYLSYKLGSPVFMVFCAVIYGCLFEKENKNGF